MQVKMTRQSLALLCLVSSVKDIFIYIKSDILEFKIEIFQIKSIHVNWIKSSSPVQNKLPVVYSQLTFCILHHNGAVLQKCH